MRQSIDIEIIGTEPPCPRCDMLDVLVRRAAAPDVKITIHHYAYDSLFSQQLGKKLGCKVGTAKHVAHAAGIVINWDAVYSLIDEKRSSLAPDARPAEAWTPELDEILRPCQEASESAGYLMTPVLLIDGKIMHHGDVPSGKQVTSWFSK